MIDLIFCLVGTILIVSVYFVTKIVLINTIKNSKMYKDIDERITSLEEKYK